ncbi:MAG: hypothetical protein ACI814_001225 [Mariniblastus sp.]|jgi:hypothetical protein
MKPIFLLSSFLTLAAIASISLAQDKPEATEVNGKIKWVFNLEEGQRLSKQSQKPMFIVFRCER